MPLTLLVPELIWPEPADTLALGPFDPSTAPGFAWLDAHGAMTRQPRQPFETALAEVFGHGPQPAGAPFGTLRLLGESGDIDAQAARDGIWLCADPVHLRFHHERIVLADAGAFEISDDEAATLVAALNREFPDVGTFHTATARRWYLKLSPTVNAEFCPKSASAIAPLSAIAGRRIDPDLDGEPTAITRWLNEVQMFLHRHPVNEARLSAGQPAINSLWLWGAGPLAVPPTPGFAGVWSDHPLATGLARAAGLPARPQPATLADLLAQASDAAQLVVLDKLLAPVLYEDAEGWRRQFETLERDWLQPLRAALGGPLQRLTLIAPTIYGRLQWTVDRGERWKFWKKGRPPAALAAHLAGQIENT